MSTAQTQSPFRRRGFIAAAIVVGVIVLAAIIVLVTSLVRGADNNNVEPTGAPTSTAAPTSNAADKSVCGLPGFEETNSLTSAPENKWELVGTVAAPSDPKGAGPGVNDDGLRTCYAHTAEGALFAGVYYVALGSDARNASRLYELVEPGPGRDAAIAASNTDSSPSNIRVQVAGFKINSYDGNEAIVDVAYSVTSKSGALVSWPLVLHWVDGDWKVAVTEEGKLPFSASPLENLGGYIPWAGV